MLSDLLQLVASRGVGILDSTVSLVFLSFTVVFLRTNQTEHQLEMLYACVQNAGECIPLSKKVLCCVLRSRVMYIMYKMSHIYFVGMQFTIGQLLKHIRILLSVCWCQSRTRPQSNHQNNARMTRSVPVGAVSYSCSWCHAYLSSVDVAPV